MKITLCAVLAFASAPCAQGRACPDLGSQRVPARVDAGPALGCAHAPGAPAWRLFVPPFREATVRPGHTRSEYRELPQILVRYECTGLLLFPVRVAEVRALGTVTDVVEKRCH